MVNKYIVEIPGLKDVIKYINASMEPDDPVTLGSVVRFRTNDNTRESVLVYQVPPKVAEVINALLAVLFGVEEVPDTSELDVDDNVLHSGQQYIEELDADIIYAILGRCNKLAIKRVQLADGHGSVTIEL